MKDLISSSPCGNVVVVGLGSQPLAYVVSTSTLLTLPPATAPITAVACTADKVAVVSGKVVSTYDIDIKGKECALSRTWEVPKKASSLVFVPETEGTPGALAVGDKAGDVTSYELGAAGGDKVRSRHVVGHTASMVTCLSFDADSEALLSGDRDEKIRVTTLSAPHRLKGLLMGHTAYVSALCAAGGKAMTAAGDGTVRLWNVKTAREIQKWDVESTASSVALGKVDAAYAIDASDEFYVCSEAEGGGKWGEARKVKAAGPVIGLMAMPDRKLCVLTSDRPHLSVYSCDSLSPCDAPASVSSLNAASAGLPSESVPRKILEGENQQGGKETGHAALVKQSKKHEVDRRLNDKGGAKKKQRKNDEEDDEV